jgi:hypothetical protein
LSRSGRRCAVGCAAAGLVVAFLGGAGAAAPPGWPTYGGDPGRSSAVAESVPPASVRPAFVLPIRGRVTSQVLAARDVPQPGLTTLYVATSAGRIYALSETGYVRWRVDLGQLPNECAQLDGYGVTGTPVIDTESKTLYAADALGRLHALDLATGAERSGWPVTLYDDPSRELVWGALALAGGRVYAATGSYCDAGPFEGKVIGVDLKTRAVSSWVAVPAEQGGGGGIWGWGGVAYGGRHDSLYVVTGNAFEGGTNTGSAFSEAAGYGESAVALDRNLKVLGASHPASIDQPLDLDFVGSPVVIDRPGCGELVVAQNKNAEVFAWRADDVSAGPLWTIELEPFDQANPVLSQLAYDPARDALYSVTGSRIVRVDVRADCSAAVAWSRTLGTDSLNGSPTVAGEHVWFALSGTPSLVAADAGSGITLRLLPLPGLTVTAPTVLDGRIFVGTFTGQLVGFTSAAAKPVPAGPPAPEVPGHASWLDRQHGWVSRETGVYATDDGGRHWRRIFDKPAATVVRTSVKAGVIRVATVAAGCACAYDLWTVDGGRHWTATRAIGGGLVGRGSSLYWLAQGGTEIQQVSPWPPRGRIRSRSVAAVDDGTIVDLALVPGGVAALVRNQTTGATSILVVHGAETETVRLPAPPGALVAESLRSAGGDLVVDGTVFSGGASRQMRWTSGADAAAWQPVAG